MNGRIVFLAISCLLGTLAALLSFPLYFPLFCLYLLYLYSIKKYSAQSIFVMSSAFLLFLSVSHACENRNHSNLPANASTFIIEFGGDMSVDGDKFQAIVKEKKTKEKLLLKYNLNSPQEKHELENRTSQNLECTVSGQLKRPSEAHNPNGFQYETFLNHQQIYWIFLSKTNPFQRCLNVKGSPLTLIKDFRTNGINYLNHHLPPQIAALSDALIFGDRGFIQSQVLTSYQEIGIIHLLAISGLHVSLLMGMIFWGGIRIGVPRERMAKFLLFFLPVYAILTGVSPSVLRSVMMLFIALSTSRWRRKLRLQPCDSISLTMMIFMLTSPYSVFEAGFELSFAVSFALVISSSLIIKNYHNNLVRMAVTSFISQLSSLPFLLYHFYEISVISVIVNLIFIPLYSFVFLPVVFLFSLLLLIGGVPSIFLTSFGHLLHLSDGLALFFAGFKIFTIVTGRPSLPVLVLVFALGLLVFFYWEKNANPKKIFPIFVLPLLLLILVPDLNRHPTAGEVTMIDVGQGDSIFIQLPKGDGTYLIDTGGTPKFQNEPWRQSIHSFEAGKDIVVPFLKGKGITSIDKLILTHGDMDHAGGSFAVMDALSVKQILIPSVAQPNATLQAIETHAKHLGIPVIRAEDGEGWKKQNALFTIISPKRNFIGTSNSGCIVLHANLGGLNWLFTGDLDIEGENRIMQEYPQMKVDILKLGHHGSKFSTSPEFLDQYSPKVALISVGENNRYGHPDPKVVNRLLLRKIIIYRTDKKGAITYTYFGDKGTFETVLP